MSDAAKDVLSSDTCASRFGVSCLNCSAHGTCKGSLPAAASLIEPVTTSEAGAAGAVTLNFTRRARPAPIRKWLGSDGEVERLRVALGDHADRKLQAPRRDVADGDRPRRVPVSALPDPEAERRRVGGHLTDGRCAEPKRAATDGERRSSSLLGVTGEDTPEGGGVERRPQLGELRGCPGNDRCGATRPVDRPVESGAVWRGARLGSRERHPGRNDVRLHAPVERKPF